MRIHSLWAVAVPRANSRMASSVQPLLCGCPRLHQWRGRPLIFCMRRVSICRTCAVRVGMQGRTGSVLSSVRLVSSGLVRPSASVPVSGVLLSKVCPASLSFTPAPYSSSHLASSLNDLLPASLALAAVRGAEALPALCGLLGLEPWRSGVLPTAARGVVGPRDDPRGKLAS